MLISRAGGDQELPLREVSISNNVTLALVINAIGVSVKELLDFQSGVRRAIVALKPVKVGGAKHRKEDAR
jgi:hypothetical protein